MNQGVAVSDYDSIDEIFEVLAALVSDGQANALFLEYESSVIKGLPKSEFFTFSFPEEVDLTKRQILYKVRPAKSYLLERIESHLVEGMPFKTARVRAIYDPS
jgi:hypothetical protein